MTKELNETLAKFTFDWMKKGDRINPMYVRKFISIAQYYEGLEEYLKTIHFISFNKYEYEPLTGCLTFSLKDLLKNYYEVGCMYKWEETARDLAEYFFVNAYILHELEHINDFKRCFEKRENVKTRICKYCYNTEIRYRKAKTFQEKLYWLKKDKQKEKIYQKNYDASPLEHFANLNSLIELIKMADFLEVQELKNYYLYKLYENLIESYEKRKSPTFYYLKRIGYSEEARKLKEKESTYSFNKRINLGLSITDEEQEVLKRTLYDKITWFE
ncbi:MAG: hypothetical protein HFJ02_05695 [Bacilli bacterium]|nr:hypothetical protein [Bacilli bacterium]